MIEINRFDCSMLADYQRCPLYFKLAWIEGYVPIEPIPALLFGECIHSCLMEWYKDKEKANEKIEKILSEMPDLSAFDKNRSREKAKVIIRAYQERYASEPYRKILALEHNFTIPMRDGTTFFGRMDMVVDFDGLIYVKDHKTSRSLASSFFSGFRPNLQMDGYSYACKILFGSCAGVIINGILVGEKIDFARQISGRTAEELQHFEETYLVDVKQIQQGLFQRRQSSCHQYYTDCRYKDICIYENDNRYVKSEERLKWRKEVKDER